VDGCRCVWAPSGVTPQRPASMPPQPPLFQYPVHIVLVGIWQFVQPGPALLAMLNPTCHQNVLSVSRC
jgi:hypothetical protein